MLRNLGLASFVLGALIIGITALSYLSMEEDVERLKDLRLDLVQTKKEHENRAGLLWDVLFRKEHNGTEPTAADRQNPLATSRDRDLIRRIGEINADIVSLERRQQRLHRRFVIFVGIGLFLCVVQAPFLVFAGRQG